VTARLLDLGPDDDLFRDWCGVWARFHPAGRFSAWSIRAPGA
jgi:hypothetical protein